MSVVEAVLRCTMQNIMKGHLCKVLGFLTSVNSDNYVSYTRPRSRDSSSIGYPKDAIHKGTKSRSRDDGEGGLNKQTHFANNDMPRRRKSQPAMRERKLTESSKATDGHGCNFSPVFANSSATSDRRRVVNVNFDKSMIMEDFENEAWRKFSETSILDGYLTTTLCSTEL